MSAEPVLKPHVWTTEEHESARADAWAAVQAGVPPFGDGECARWWMAIAEGERERWRPLRQRERQP